MVSISPKEIQDNILKHEEILLVDVREPYEHENFNIGGILIPIDTLFDNIHLIPKDKPVIIYCEKGIRSQIAIQRLQQRFNYTNLINLAGGMNAWKKEKARNQSFNGE